MVRGESSWNNATKARPQATINLDGRRLTRSEVSNDWGPVPAMGDQSGNGQVVRHPSMPRTGLSYEHADTAPGNYEVVLQMWRYVNYAKNPQGEFTASRFIDVSQTA